MVEKWKDLWKGKKKLCLGVIAAVVAVILAASLGIGALRNGPNSPEVVTTSTLEKIINISKLSTYTTTYNGIACHYNEEDPEKVEYYVSYEAKVNTGIEFQDVDITMDEETKVIHVAVPQVTITEIVVDFGSMEFLFYDDDGDTPSLGAQAYEECQKDVKQEAEAQSAIFDLAEKSAVNVLTALLQPVVDQLGQEYTLVVE